MSQARAAIARLSFVLRIFLYIALLGAVASIGFGYSAGYLAIPGDSALRLSGHNRQVLILRKLDCEVSQTIATPAAGPQPPSSPPAPPKPAPDHPAPPAGDCAEAPMLGLRSIALGPMKQVTVLRDDQGNEIEVRRDSGEGKAHLTIRNGGKTTERDIDGTTIPAEVLNEIPEPLRAGAQKAVASPPAPPIEAIAQHRIVLIDDDGTRVKLTRKGAGKLHIAITRSGKTTEYDISGPAVPADILQQLPEKLRPTLEQMASGDGALPPPPPPGAPGGFEAPAPDDDVVLSGGPPMTDGFPEMRERIVELPGPAIIQQQVVGHTGLRAALVGITIALVFLAIIQLERLLAHFQRAELFSARNSGLLRNLGALLIAVAFVQGAATLLPALLARALDPALLGALGPHLLLVFGGFAILLLAAVWAEAARLEDETAHTV